MSKKAGGLFFSPTLTGAGAEEPRDPQHPSLFPSGEKTEGNGKMEMEAACGKEQHIFLITKKRYTALK